MRSKFGRAPSYPRADPPTRGRAFRSKSGKHTCPPASGFPLQSLTQIRVAYRVKSTIEVRRGRIRPLWNFLPYPRSAFWEMLRLVYEGITKRKYSYAFFKDSLKFAWIIFWTVMLLTLVIDLMKLF
jgi:hypothetical protein